MNAKETKLGLLGALVFSMLALPAYAAPPPSRNDDPRAHPGQSDNRGRDQKADLRYGRDDHRDVSFGRSDGRKDMNVQIHIGPGPMIAHRPEPVRYEIRTETVLVEPAHYERRTETVLVREGRWEDRLIPGRRELLRDSRGNLHEVQVAPDRMERVWCPPVYETRSVMVLVPARYETRTVRVPVTGRWDDRRAGTAQGTIDVGLHILGSILGH